MQKLKHKERLKGVTKEWIWYDELGPSAPIPEGQYNPGRVFYTTPSDPIGYGPIHQEPIHIRVNPEGERVEEHPVAPISYIEIGNENGVIARRAFETIQVQSGDSVEFKYFVRFV